MAIDKTQLGAAIKQVRTARGLSQVDLARAAGLSESGNSVALIERGERSVSLDTLNALAAALRIPPACLTILGSTRLAGSKEANAFMERLKGLITATLLAQAQLPADVEEKNEQQTHAGNAAGILSE